MKFENTIVINKPEKQVFAYLARLEHLPDWNYAIRRTVTMTPGNQAVGARYLQERTLPRPMTETLEITAYTQDTLLEISGGFGLFPAGKSTYKLSAIDHEKTIVQNEIELEVKGLIRPLASIAALKIKAAVAQNLVVLKHILETDI